MAFTTGQSRDAFNAETLSTEAIREREREGEGGREGRREGGRERKWEGERERERGQAKQWDSWWKDTPLGTRTNHKSAPPPPPPPPPYSHISSMIHCSRRHTHLDHTGLRTCPPKIRDREVRGHSGPATQWFDLQPKVVQIQILHSLKVYIGSWVCSSKNAHTKNASLTGKCHVKATQTNCQHCPLAVLSTPSLCNTS